jgi:CRISPR-associated protein Cmr4
MYQKIKPLFLICETPLHAGSGSDLGIVDLPIQRERHTSFPKIEASSLKGALREAVEERVASKTFTSIDANDTKIHRVFGYDDGSLDDKAKDNLKRCFSKKGKEEEYAIDFAGAIGFTDARLLFFPLKSMRGVFAWVTCPKVLQQFQTDMQLGDIEVPELEKEFSNGNALITPDSTLTIGAKKKIVLEEYAFGTIETEFVNTLGEWLSTNVLSQLPNYWKNKIKTDIVILSNDDFKDFVNLSTEVITRTKIDNETGTVAGGALFTEEYLPAESIMYSLVMAHDEFTANKDKMPAENVLDFFCTQLSKKSGIVQIGGNATLGKGIVRTSIL